MERHVLQPLTNQERKFAEENHNLVYGFLRKNGYSVEDFYSIAVFGYLKAVEVYHRKEKLKGNYNFSSMAYRYMQAEMSNYFRNQHRKMRKPTGTVESLDAENTKSQSLYDHIVGEKSAEAQFMEAETIDDILENFTELQRKIVEMKMDGFSSKEVFLILDMRQSTFYKELQKIKTMLEQVIG
ncbi:MAG: sigma-70 family RNA polymerase sigma factor [Blautia sp.]|nr:sigma-70 family RNA polymerase sigma factor [Blautia sp.]